MCHGTFLHNYVSWCSMVLHEHHDGSQSLMKWLWSWQIASPIFSLLTWVSGVLLYLTQPPKPSLQSSPSWPGHSNPPATFLSQSINQSGDLYGWCYILIPLYIVPTTFSLPENVPSLIKHDIFVCSTWPPAKLHIALAPRLTATERTSRPRRGRGTSRETVLKCANPNHGNLTKKHCNLVVPTRTMSNQCKIQKL